MASGSESVTDPSIIAAAEAHSRRRASEAAVKNAAATASSDPPEPPLPGPAAASVDDPVGEPDPKAEWGVVEPDVPPILPAEDDLDAIAGAENAPAKPKVDNPEAADPELPEQDPYLKKVLDGLSQEEIDSLTAEFNSLSDEKKLELRLGLVMDFINKGRIDGVFSSDDTVVLADNGLQFKGDRTSENLRGLVLSLKELGDGEPQDKYQEISKNILVTGPNNMIYRLEQLDRELVNASTPEKRAEIQQIINGGHFEISHHVEARMAIQEEVSLAMVRLNVKIKALEQSGGSGTEFRTILGRLQAARELKGADGALYSIKILNEAKGKGITIDDKVFESKSVMQEDSEQAKKDHLESRLKSLVASKKLTEKQAKELESQFISGDFRALMKNKNLGELGLDEFFYGRKMNEAELEAEMIKLVDPKDRKALKGLGMVALLALLLSKALFDDAVPSLTKVEG